MLKTAEQRGLKAGDMEVIQFVERIPFFQRNGEFDKRLYANIVKNVFRREARDFEEGLRDQIKIMKLFAPTLQAISFTDEQVRKEYEHRNQKVQVNYILVPPGSFQKDVAVTDEALHGYFDAHREDFLEPEAVNARIITLPLAPKASAADKAAMAAKAAELRTALASGADPVAAAKNSNATIKETGFFTTDAPSPDITPSLEVLQTLFTAKTGDLLDPVEGPGGYQIIRIAEKKPAFIPEFMAVKDKVSAALVNDKAAKLAAEKAAAIQKTIAEKTKTGMDFSAAARDLGLEPKQTPFFGLGEYVPEIGMSDDFTTAAFNLNKDHALSGVILTSRGPALLCWAATQPVDEKKFLEVKKDFTDSLYTQERIRVMNELIRSLREKAGLVSYIDQINAQQKEAMEKMRLRK